MKRTALLASSLTAGMLALAQPASAVIFDWQFTNEDGNFGNPTDVVAGFVEFSSYATYAEIANQTDVSASNLQITSVTGLSDTSLPFFGDGGIEMNTNLISAGLDAANTNFSFDGVGEIYRSW